MAARNFERFLLSGMPFWYIVWESKSSIKSKYGLNISFCLNVYIIRFSIFISCSFKGKSTVLQQLYFYQWIFSRKIIFNNNLTYFKLLPQILSDKSFKKKPTPPHKTKLKGGLFDAKAIKRFVYLSVEETLNLIPLEFSSRKTNK